MNTTPDYIEARESPVYVRAGSARYFTFGIENAASVSIVIHDVTTATPTDVTSTIAPGSPVVGADSFRTPLATFATSGRKYRITGTYTKGGETLNPYVRVITLP